MKYRKKPVVIEAITFDELVEYGKANGANIVNGMPWSFDYKGQPITHENYDCYLIPTANGSSKLLRGDMLCSQEVNGKVDLWPVAGDIFEATYETVEP